MIYTTAYSSPIGNITLGSDGDALVDLWFEGQKYFLNVYEEIEINGAVGRNPISIIIPCHRVVEKNNALTGYAGGVDKKIMLLKLENSNVKLQ